MAIFPSVVNKLFLRSRYLRLVFDCSASAIERASSSVRRFPSKLRYSNGGFPERKSGIRLSPFVSIPLKLRVTSRSVSGHIPPKRCLTGEYGIPFSDLPNSSHVIAGCSEMASKRLRASSVLRICCQTSINTQSNCCFSAHRRQTGRLQAGYQSNSI